jgi:hypothetical protein
MFVNDSSIIYVTVNTTARIEIFAEDDDGDPLTFNISGILPETLIVLTNYSRSVVIVWEVTTAKVSPFVIYSLRYLFDVTLICLTLSLFDKL